MRITTRFLIFSEAEHLADRVTVRAGVEEGTLIEFNELLSMYSENQTTKLFLSIISHSAFDTALKTITNYHKSFFGI